MSLNSQILSFSYYELSLLSFLKESHPDKADDFAFIKARAEQAAEAYSVAYNDALPIPICVEIANRTLFKGLHFSKHDIIGMSLSSEFALSDTWDSIPQMAIRLQPSLEKIFDGYDLDDEFASTPEFDLLYDEITDSVRQKIEEDGSL